MRSSVARHQCTMWDLCWYVGLPLLVIAAPFEPSNYDVVYDQRQNGSENYQVSVDGLSLVWSPNSLLAAAALLEPALYGEYPETGVDFVLGPSEPATTDASPANSSVGAPPQPDAKRRLRVPSLLKSVLRRGVTPVHHHDDQSVP